MYEIQRQNGQTCLYMQRKKHSAYTRNLSQQIQSALVISNSKGLSEIHRDTRTSTYQISRIEGKKSYLQNVPNSYVIWLLYIRYIY